MKIDERIPNGGKLLDEYLSKLSDDDLRSAYREAHEKLREAKEDLRSSRASARGYGNYSSPGTYSTMLATERVRVVQLESMAAELGRRKRSKNAARAEAPNSPLGGDDFTRAFYRSAREMLSPALVKKLRERADEIISEALATKENT